MVSVLIANLISHKIAERNISLFFLSLELSENSYLELLQLNLTFYL